MELTLVSKCERESIEMRNRMGKRETKRYILTRNRGDPLTRRGGSHREDPLMRRGGSDTAENREMRCAHFNTRYRFQAVSSSEMRSNIVSASPYSCLS